MTYKRRTTHQHRKLGLAKSVSYVDVLFFSSKEDRGKCNDIFIGIKDILFFYQYMRIKFYLKSNISPALITEYTHLLLIIYSLIFPYNILHNLAL